jgi:hypothetical protein
MIFEIPVCIPVMALGIYFFSFVLDEIRTDRIRHTDIPSIFHL